MTDVDRLAARRLAVALLLACAAATGACGGGSHGASYRYDVPTSASSPWPMMRRTSANDGLSPLLPPTDARGAEPWRYPTGKGIFSVPVIGEDQRVLVGSADRSFYAIEPDGSLAWKFDTGEIIDSAGSVGADGTIYFGSGDGHLYALDADGHQRWAFAAHNEAGSPGSTQGNRCSDLPPAGGASTWFEGNVVIGPEGRLWAGNDDFRMYSLDPDGTERFNFFVGPIPFGAVWSAATTRADGSAVYGGMDFFVYAVSADGNCLWRRVLNAPVSASPARAPDGTIYIGSWDGSLYALDGTTGEVRWKVATGAHIYASAALGADGTIYVGSTDGSLYAVSPDGHLLWTFDTLDPIRSSPSVDGRGRIYFGAGDGALYALDPDGTRAWSYDATTQDRNDLNSSPVLGSERIYLGSEDGSILGVPYAYCAAASDPRCNTSPASDLGDDGASLYYVTPGGRSFTDVPEPVERGAAFTVRLLVRAGGDTRAGSFDLASFSVHSQPAADWEVVEQGGGQWVNLVPSALLTAGTHYQLDVSSRWTAPGTPGGSVSHSFAFDTVGEPSAPPSFGAGNDSVPAFEIRNLAPYQPPLIVSLNQIGFDSLDFLASVIESQPGQFLLWLMTGKAGANGTEIDPATPSLVAMDGVLDGASFAMNGVGLTLVTGGPPIQVRDFRVASQFDATGHFDAGTSMMARASCADLGLIGSFLSLFQLCNGAGEFVAVGTIRGATYDGTANHRPDGVALAELTRSGSTVTARFTAPGYKLAEHLPAIVLLDDATGHAVQMDYRKALVGHADPAGDLASVTLTIPPDVELPAGPIRAIVLTDLFPLASSVLPASR